MSEERDEGAADENAEGPAAKPLSRLPVVAFGLLVLVASAVWLSCHEYESGAPPPTPGAPHADDPGTELRAPDGAERKTE